LTNTTGDSNMSRAANETRVAGTLQVQIDVQGNLSEAVIEDMFRRAIAAAVDVPVKLVVKLEVSEITAPVKVNGSEMNSSSGVRRLLSVQSKWYEVAYEVVVPSNLDADAVVSRANRIAVADSAESLLFREALMATEGVENIGEIVSKVAASKVEVTTAAPSSQPDEEDGRSWKAVVIGAVAVLLGLTCLVASAFFIRRKMSSSSSDTSSRFATV